MENNKRSYWKKEKYMWHVIPFPLSAKRIQNYKKMLQRKLEFLETLKPLKINKAPGFDEIDVKVINHLYNHIKKTPSGFLVI